MDYTIRREGSAVVVENLRDFHPVHVFECGQCFRWVRQQDESYTGVVRGKVANLRFQDDCLTIKDCTLEEFHRTWFDYLDLGRDYTAIKQELMEKDEIMRKAVPFGYGIRILRQELWETLISFILSSNNRVPRIMQIVEAISTCYGRELTAWGCRYHAFPEVQMLSESTVDELAACRGGYRCRYVLGTAGMVREGTVRLDSIAGMQTAEARHELTRFPGVGDKVADCTLLYSGTRYDVFPTDVWVKRVMEELYFGREASMQEIQAFAAEYFGELRGFAQQYLFYYARKNRIGIK